MNTFAEPDPKCGNLIYPQPFYDNAQQRDEVKSPPACLLRTVRILPPSLGGMCLCIDESHPEQF